MPTNDETFEHSCSGTWEPVAGPGRVFIENLSVAQTLHWAISGGSAPTVTRGYSLPASNGARSGAEGILVPSAKVLWLRGEAGQTVAMTAETLP